ncbi:MAG: DUF1127 domain-containing protein [Gemmobacter sp.]
MAAFETTRDHRAGTLVGGGLRNFVASLVGAVVAWNDARVTRNALSKLSDRELDDIGLTRADIDTISARGL